MILVHTTHPPATLAERSAHRSWLPRFRHSLHKPTTVVQSSGVRLDVRAGASADAVRATSVSCMTVRLTLLRGLRTICGCIQMEKGFFYTFSRLLRCVFREYIAYRRRWPCCRRFRKYPSHDRSLAVGILTIQHVMQVPESGSSRGGRYSVLHDFCMQIPYGFLIVLSGLILGIRGPLAAGVLLGLVGMAVLLCARASLQAWKSGRPGTAYTVMSTMATAYLTWVFGTQLPG